MFSFPYHTEKGQGLAEYGQLLVLVAVVVVAIVALFGNDVKLIYCSAVHQIAPEADLSEACSVPIIMPRLLDSGPNFINVEARIHDPDGNPNNPYAAMDKVEFYIDDTDGSPVTVERSHHYCLGTGDSSCSNFSTGGLPAGPHKVIILAYDDDGNVGRATRRFTK